MRLEPILHLLGIPFDTNVARDVMTERHGMATRLLYQMYIALNNKKKANLTGVAMETQRPAAPAKLNAIESGIYKEVRSRSYFILWAAFGLAVRCYAVKQNDLGLIHCGSPLCSKVVVYDHCLIVTSPPSPQLQLLKH